MGYLREMEQAQWRERKARQDYSDRHFNLTMPKNPGVNFEDLLRDSWKSEKTTFLQTTIQQKGENMDLLNSFKNLFLTEPDKTFRKLHIIHDSGLLTEEGKDLFLNFMFRQHKDEFYKQVAEPLLQERKEDK